MGAVLWAVELDPGGGTGPLSASLRADTAWGPQDESEDPCGQSKGAGFSLIQGMVSFLLTFSPIFKPLF